MEYSLFDKATSRVAAISARHRFVTERLDYDPSHQAGLDYIRTTHSAYLPESLKQEKESEEGEWRKLFH